MSKAPAPLNEYHNKSIDFMRNEETLPDKDLVRESLQNNDGKAPKKAHLQRKFSLTYNLRKRDKVAALQFHSKTKV